MDTAKIFMNGRSQAVRLPKEFRLTGTQVRIRRLHNGILLLPEHRNWETLFGACGTFSKDFFRGGRKQPPLEKRPRLRR